MKIITGGARSDLPFSPGIVVGDVLHISGQASVDREDGHIITGTFEEEMRRSIENLRAILEAAGLSLDHVFSVRCYLADPADGAEHNRIYPEYFSKPYPVRSTTISMAGSRLKYELDALANIRTTRQEAERV
ncbi:MAG: RidA family protein [Rubellimicrobium sp.]|nr:RidA family protein [Rubellimicrobium sp.]